MSQSNFPHYEIPAEFRQFAEQGVEQARKAFTGFLDAANKAVDTFAAPNSFNAGAGDMTRRTLAYAEHNVTAALDLAQKLVKAKDVSEAMKHQADYLQSQVVSLQSQVKDFTAAVQKAGEEVTQTATKAAAPTKNGTKAG
ncbi:MULTISPECIES: phasin family protein [unclassified Chelatococcus]|jgi:phasin|uniref:phasin family protein n=1 Tax=unclassified Chelatococcus TaxID=2638111 RepID=UPI001BD039C3|nr:MULTISPECIES: phasin family protein [unclassified Chelatococcus]CAH1649507.1 Phasin [Hyphomicrobiales bacterium]MBS7739614.1 phasin family protein [Chelatococcus sp. HY11]MBX3543983.1 phasin family protein [Chelatococcus sp.]MCO5075849.1 phasin family protein [Chelatococcus sp.]CAH1667231.1 Phasin [Hyphomicrobiales bacterium]